MIKLGIIGASGYTGSELVRILSDHPDASIEVITSEKRAGKKFSSVYTQYVGLADAKLHSIKEIRKMKLDLVFLCLPHGVSMNFVRDMGCNNFKVIDLSGDFRLTSAQVYKKWYRKKHSAPDYLDEAVFGLPELNRSAIRLARLVANPGCYPTSAILALAPLLKNKLIEPRGIVIDSKSGASGAGAQSKASTHFPEVVGNFKAYAILNHRHSPEIQQVLSDYSGQEVEILFTPHLLPVDRGILTTTYSRATGITSKDDIWHLFHAFYRREKFVRVVETPPGIKDVRGSNYCDIYATYDRRTNTVVTVSVIDNLVKGAAGQAVQNMNIMFNLLEAKGLEAMPLSP
jgi:N-acetyl-gamma-glutamyl-phosphate reductase